MKYTVKMACGHEETVELFGKGAERERKIHWLEENGLCKECRQSEELKKAEGLPALSGSEKQVAWAVKIRNSFIEKFEGIATPDPMFKKFMNWLKVQTEARWWIDHRDSMMRAIVQEFAKEVKK